MRPQRPRRCSQLALAMRLTRRLVVPLRGLVSDLRPYEAWQADGALWTSERAHRLVPRVLDQAPDPGLSSAAEEALERFVADRCAG